MRFLNPGKVFGFSVIIILAIVVNAPTSKAQQMTSIAGKMTSSYTKTDSLVVAPGHNLTLALSKGTNASTGPNSFIDGGEVTNISFSDLTMGTGPHQGYVKLEKDGNSATAKWSGKVSAKMVEGSPPVISFQGTFSYVMGTGKFAGITGEGTFKGMFTSKTDYVAEWQGTYSLGK